jgi:hypothetical protein
MGDKDMDKTILEGTNILDDISKILDKNPSSEKIRESCIALSMVFLAICGENYLELVFFQSKFGKIKEQLVSLNAPKEFLEAFEFDSNFSTNSEKELHLKLFISLAQDILAKQALLTNKSKN